MRLATRFRNGLGMSSMAGFHSAALVEYFVSRDFGRDLGRSSESEAQTSRPPARACASSTRERPWQPLLIIAWCLMSLEPLFLVFVGEDGMPEGLSLEEVVGRDVVLRTGLPTSSTSRRFLVGLVVTAGAVDFDLVRKPGFCAAKRLGALAKRCWVGSSLGRDSNTLKGSSITVLLGRVGLGNSGTTMCSSSVTASKSSSEGMSEGEPGAVVCSFSDKSNMFLGRRRGESDSAAMGALGAGEGSAIVMSIGEPSLVALLNMVLARAIGVRVLFLSGSIGNLVSMGESKLSDDKSVVFGKSEPESSVAKDLTEGPKVDRLSNITLLLDPGGLNVDVFDVSDGSDIARLRRSSSCATRFCTSHSNSTCMRVSSS